MLKSNRILLAPASPRRSISRACTARGLMQAESTVADVWVGGDSTATLTTTFTVPAAIAECRRAGIRVVMITGDYPETARFIATSAGLGDGEILTGEKLRALGDEDLAERLDKVNVFARIMPNEKLRLVEAFKARGEVVAMTGDGVNDAPSLKAADIGIAMGQRGTDVAREASTIVLLNDDFGSIAKSIRLGRRIYDNLRKAMAFIFAVHVPIAGLALLPLLLGFPLLLAPVHIALLEMIIDPVCALVFEAEKEESDVMQRPPRQVDSPRNAIDESTDAYDTIEWLLQHVPNHNGRVGIWGGSYSGFYTVAGIIDTHPAIRAASPQAL